MKKALVIDSKDNVTVALNNIIAGEKAEIVGAVRDEVVVTGHKDF